MRRRVGACTERHQSSFGVLTSSAARRLSARGGSFLSSLSRLSVGLLPLDDQRTGAALFVGRLAGNYARRTHRPNCNLADRHLRVLEAHWRSSSLCTYRLDTLATSLP